MDTPWIEVGGVVFRAPMTAGTNLLLSVQCAVALGLLPVILAETLRREPIEGGGMVAGGLALSLLTGLVYVGEVSLGRWLNHIDVAHLVMGVSFYLIHRGLSRSGSAAWS